MASSETLTECPPPPPQHKNTHWQFQPSILPDKHPQTHTGLKPLRDLWRIPPTAGQKERFPVLAPILPTDQDASHIPSPMKEKYNSSLLQFVIGRTPLSLIDVFLGQQAFVDFSGPDKDTQMGPLEMKPIVVAFLWRHTNETCGCY